MAEFSCQKCEQQIYYSTVAGEDIVRCTNCGARHVLPRLGDSNSNWVERSKRLQDDDDSYYRKWMPWLYRVWIGLLSLIYIQARLSKIFNGDPGSSHQPASWFEPLLMGVMFPLLGVALAWMFYVHTRCYGFIMSWKALYGHRDLRWLLSAFVVAVVVVLAFEVVIRFSQSQ